MCIAVHSSTDGYFCSRAAAPRAPSGNLPRLVATPPHSTSPRPPLYMCSIKYDVESHRTMAALPCRPLAGKRAADAPVKLRRLIRRLLLVMLAFFLIHHRFDPIPSEVISSSGVRFNLIARTGSIPFASRLIDWYQIIYLSIYLFNLFHIPSNRSRKRVRIRDMGIFATSCADRRYDADAITDGVQLMTIYITVRLCTASSA